MTKMIYKFAVLIGLITLIFCIASGISLITSFERSIMVFLGTLIAFIVSANLLKWGIHFTRTEPDIQMKPPAETGQDKDE